jgi:tetratricopeptide (TPR) repeat protein
MKIITFVLIFFLMVTNMFSQENYELLFIKGEYEKILEDSQRFSNPNDYFWNSLVLNRQGETMKSITTLMDGLNQFPDDQMLEKQLIEFRYKSGQYAQIKDILPDYLDIPEMFLRYMIILAFDGEYHLAVDHLNEKLQTDSLNTEFLSLLGDYYFQMDSLTASIQALEKLIAINPLDMKSLNKLANFYVKNKDFVKAILVCDGVLANDSLNKKFNRIKGIAGFNNADFDVAYVSFKRLIEQGDSGKFVLKHLGISELKTSMFDSAREHLLMAYQEDSTDLEINYYLGKAFLNSPNPEKGLFYFNRVDSLMQPDPKILSSLYFEKQSIYSALGNFPEALKNYELAYQYHPKPEYIFYMASIYQYKLNDKKKAVEYYERFLALLPPSPQSETHISDGKQKVVSLSQIAQRNIVDLKEDLFFSGN